MANGNVHDAHNGCVLGHLMNNSYRLGKKVPFNAKAGSFGDNKDAYEHFMKVHGLRRDGGGVPENGAELKDPNSPGFEIPAIGKV